MGTVRSDITGDVLHIELHRPEKRNAINDAMFVDLAEAAEAARDDTSIAAVVLSGAGSSFCAGLDFDVHRTLVSEGIAGQRPYSDPADSTATGVRKPGRGQRIVRALRDCPVPVIVVIHGHAIGGGLQLALAGDIRVAAPDAILASAEIEFGMTLDMGGNALLPRLVGHERALELILAAKRVTGRQAAAMGLVTSLSDDPFNAAMTLATTIADRSKPAVRDSKRLCRLAEIATVDEVMQQELTTMATNIGSEAQVQAAQTYFARRATRRC